MSQTTAATGPLGAFAYDHRIVRNFIAAVTLPLGITTSNEYAEVEWLIDLLIAVVWLVFAANLFGTISIFKRRERPLYVAIWFYIASEMRQQAALATKTDLVKKEVIALIAYFKRLGHDLHHPWPTTTAAGH